MCGALLLLTAVVGQVGALPECVGYVNMAGGDLPGMPLIANDSAACAEQCIENTQCSMYTFVGSASPRAVKCRAQSGAGCCWLKSIEKGGMAPEVWDEHACSAILRVPGSPLGVRPVGEAKKNVLYITVDDLRPELNRAYGQEFAHTPNMDKLAETGVTFDNAYCQISVCSPSRLSFLSGRRPDHAGMYNFINHFRQADCGIALPNVSYTAPDVVPPVPTTSYGGGCHW
eukprot:Hpha_TRINITY_DN35372_c0_g1::TRINITY_DN35372_c0_g1_i1::g.85153::m.85153